MLANTTSPGPSDRFFNCGAYSVNFNGIYYRVPSRFLDTTRSFQSVLDLSCGAHIMADSSPPSGPGIGGQALLKRRAGSSLEEFREHYVTRHGPIAIPWCLANGVSYYAQVHAPEVYISLPAVTRMSFTC